MFVYIIYESRDILLIGRNKEGWRVIIFYGVFVKFVYIKYVYSNSINKYR